MRRAPMVVAASAAGLAAVVLSHPGKAITIKANTTAPSSAGAHNGHPNNGHPGAVSGPVASAPAQSATGARTATGKAENYGYGTLAVRVTAAGRRIVQVSVPTLNTLDSYSQSIAQQVIPMLRREVLSVQSANIQGVSGATYTSEAYAYSLQAALKQLGL